MKKESFLLKNPLIQSKLKTELKNPAGNIIEEVSEADADVQIGGSILASIGWTVAIATSGIVAGQQVVSASATNPGRLCTISAECRRDYKNCG